MEDFSWIKPGTDYWENPGCPREHLEKEFIWLVWNIEGARVSREHIKNMSGKELRERCGFYEYVLGK